MYMYMHTCAKCTCMILHAVYLSKMYLNDATTSVHFSRACTEFPRATLGVHLPRSVTCIAYVHVHVVVTSFTPAACSGRRWRLVHRARHPAEAGSTPATGRASGEQTARSRARYDVAAEILSNCPVWWQYFYFVLFKTNFSLIKPELRLRG